MNVDSNSDSIHRLKSDSNAEMSKRHFFDPPHQWENLGCLTSGVVRRKASFDAIMGIGDRLL